MLFNQLAAVLAALAVTAQAEFTIPEDQPAGSYVVTYNETGFATHTRMEDFDFGAVDANAPALAPAPISIRGSHLAARERDLTVCGNKAEMDHGDTDYANSALDGDCGGEGGKVVPAGADFYQYGGKSAVAFFCNFNNSPNRCDARSRRLTSAAITAECGWYKAGWVNIREYGVSYGYDFRGSKFCGHDHA